MITVPDEVRHSWRLPRPLKWRPLTGCKFVPVVTASDVLGADGKPVMQKTGFSRMVYSHEPGALIATAPKRTGGQCPTYIVLADHSLREITPRAFEHLGSVKQSERIALLREQKEPAA